MHTLGPILWDLNRLEMLFWHHNHIVHWKGIGAKSLPRVHALQSTNPLASLLEEFADLFATPSGLPPPRSFDHRVHLLPQTAPVAVRPYRYAQLLKDEIEAQC